MAAHSRVLAWRIPGPRSSAATVPELTVSDTTELGALLEKRCVLPAAGRAASQELTEVRPTALATHHTPATHSPLHDSSIHHCIYSFSPHSTNIS